MKGVRRAERPSEAGFASDAFLKDGTAVRIRAIRPDDQARLVDLAGRCSDRTLYYRFFTPPPLPITPERLEFLANVDHDSRVALVAVLGGDEDERVIAVARWDTDPDDPRRAEVAFLVEDAYQGLGLGTMLLHTLADLAPRHGINKFDATVLADNRGMLVVFKRSGFSVMHEIDSGVYHVEFPVHPTQAATEAADAASSSGAAAALSSVLEPSRIAVIGASRRSGSLGTNLLRNVVASGFSGSVIPVNPNVESIASIPTVSSVDDLPDGVDLAVVAVPAKKVPDVVEKCGKRGVKAVHVVSSGFGPPDSPLRVDLLNRCRASGMRLLGPASMGVVNTSPVTSLNLTVGDTEVQTGSVGIASQSGVLGIGILQYLHSLDLGISQFVSLGDRDDISSNDLLAWWEDEGSTRVILLYLETFGNPRKFGRLARRVGRHKPIAVAASDEVAGGPGATALFRQAGVIRTKGLEELIDTAALLASQPIPSDNRLVIVSNAGGGARLGADAAVDADLELVTLPDAARRALEGMRTVESAVNPIELSFGSRTSSPLREVLQVIRDEVELDSLLVVYVPLSQDDVQRVREMVVNAARSMPNVCVAACLMTSHGAPRMLIRGRVAVPSYQFPEAAVRSIGHVTFHGKWRRQPEGEVFELDEDDVDPIRGVADEHAPGLISGEAAHEILAHAGIAVDGKDAGEPDFVALVGQDGNFGTVLGLGTGTDPHGLDPNLFRMVPLTDVDALHVTSRTVESAGLDVPVDALVDCLRRLSAVLEAEPRIESGSVALSLGPAGECAAGEARFLLGGAPPADPRPRESPW